MQVYASYSVWTLVVYKNEIQRCRKEADKTETDVL